MFYIRFDVLCNSFHSERFGRLKNLYDFILELEPDANCYAYYDKAYSVSDSRLACKSIWKKTLDNSPPSSLAFYKQDFYSCEKRLLIHAGLPRAYTHISIVYQVPTLPSVLVNWIAFFALYICNINSVLKSTLHVQFNSHLPFINISENTKIENLFYKENIHTKAVRLLMRTIISMELNDDVLLSLKSSPYQEALKDLKKIEYNCQGMDNKIILTQLIHSLSSYGRSNLFYSEQI